MSNEKTDSPKRRYWFSPNRFLKTMEILACIPLLVSLAASSITVYFVHYALTADSQDYNGVGAAIGAGIFSQIALFSFLIANFFVIAYYCYPNFEKCPKGISARYVYIAAVIPIPILFYVLYCP